MDTVPLSFYEAVCVYFHTATLPAVAKLSGYCGETARSTLANRAFYYCAVKDGIEGSQSLKYVSSGRVVRTPEGIEAVPKKFVEEVTIHLQDGKKESVSREIVKRFPYSSCLFVLHSSSINEAWVDFACSLNRVTSVAIAKKLDDNAIPLLQKLFDSRKFWLLHIYEEACEGDIMEVLKSLLCQEQFEHLYVKRLSAGSWNSVVVLELLEFWAENSERLRGTSMSVVGHCEDGVQQLEKFILERAGVSTTDEWGTLRQMTVDAGLARSLNHFGMNFALNLCSKEECDLIDKYYRHNHTLFFKPSCVYKYEEGEGDKRRRIYISFECSKDENANTIQRPASPNGHNELKFMRETGQLLVMFD
uniref:BACK domain-containing protein n=1 Tax=Steinernema glaseri TaxID=37863 RepID=A0A1I7ZTB2_9BILA